MEYRDYYEILASKKSATQTRSSAYRKARVRKYHPDPNKDEDRTKSSRESAEANEVP
jgi:DnaJ-class molecular chaperone